MKRAVWTGWVLAAFVMIFPSSGWGAECEDVAPGVQYCKETMTPPGSSGSVTNHWTLIDLTEPSLQVRVTRENEGFKKPSTIANTLDTTVTINGDWINFNTNKPVGLSVGAGVQWPGSVDQGPSSSLGDWGTLSCDPGKVCQMSPINVLWEYFPPLDHNVIGGNGQRLVIDGVVQYPAFDNQRRPRSGVCINATSSEMMLLVGEGEAGGVNKGWKTQDFAAYAHQLGCYNGLMLDGGGSSTLVIEGQRVNQLQQAEPYERTLINHLHIIHNKEFASGGIDPVCADSPNAVVCDGSVRVNCAAGKAEVLGDCGFFGASCGTVGTTAVCLDWECSVASGIACVSSTKATECAFGEVQAELSCNSGMECIMSNGEAQCVDEICKGQPAKWCDGNTLHHCQAALTLDPVTQMKHSTEACSESGKICDPEALVCVDPPPEPTLSCAGACGGQGDGCGCSDACGAAGDCCPDLCTHCSEHPQCQSGEEGPEDEPEEGGASEEEETPESPESSEEGGDESSVEPEPEEESPESSTESSSEEELDWGVDQAGDESSWAVNSGEETEENSDTEILVGESSLQEDEESAGEGKALGLSGTSSGDSEEGGCHSGSSFPFPMPLLLVLAVMGVRRETGIFTDPR